MNKLQSVIKELSEFYGAGGMKTTRFSITLSERDNNRLEKLADKIQISKQELINKLLVASIADLEEALRDVDKTTVPIITLADLDDGEDGV